MPALDLSARVTPQRITEIAQDLFQTLQERVAPLINSGQWQRAGAAIESECLMKNIICHQVQIMEGLRGGDDFIPLLQHRRRGIVGEGLKTTDLLALGVFLKAAQGIPEFLTPAPHVTFLELALEHHRLAIRGVRPEVLKKSVQGVTDLLQTVFREAEARQPAQVPADAYERVATAICINLLGTFKANIAGYHSGLKFSAPLAAFMETERDGTGDGLFHLREAFIFGRQLGLAIQTGNH